MTDAPKEKSVPTIVVLAASSVMLSVGVAAWWLQPSEGAKRQAPVTTIAPVHVTVDVRTPERTAESFLDAWRKRAHDDALSLSEDEAHERVRARKQAEDQMTPADRAYADTIWRRLADMRLHLEVRESERTPEQDLILRGHAKGMWLGKPYDRPVEFRLSERASGWRVTRFAFGDVTDPDMPRIEQ